MLSNIQEAAAHRQTQGAAAPGQAFPLAMLARYNAWCNLRMFDALEALPAGEATKERPTRFKNMVHTMNHIYVVDRIFRAHLEGWAHGYNAKHGNPSGARRVASAENRDRPMVRGPG